MEDDGQEPGPSSRHKSANRIGIINKNDRFTHFNLRRQIYQNRQHFNDDNRSMRQNNQNIHHFQEENRSLRQNTQNIQNVHEENRSWRQNTQNIQNVHEENRSWRQNNQHIRNFHEENRSMRQNNQPVQNFQEVNRSMSQNNQHTQNYHVENRLICQNDQNIQNSHDEIRLLRQNNHEVNRSMRANYQNMQNSLEENRTIRQSNLNIQNVYEENRPLKQNFHEKNKSLRQSNQNVRNHEHNRLTRYNIDPATQQNPGMRHQYIETVYGRGGMRGYKMRSGRDNQRFRFFAFKTLEEIAKSEEKEVLHKINEKREAFMNLVNSPIEKHDVFVLLMEILSKVTQSLFVELKSKLLFDVCNSEFINYLRNYLMDLPYVENKLTNSLYWKDQSEFWNNFIIFCGDIVDTCPFIAHKRCRALIESITKSCLECLNDRHGFVLSEANVLKLNEIRYKMASYDEKYNISAPEFNKLPIEGGCFEKCNYQYDCGHKCQLYYHGDDLQHIETKCTMNCDRVLCDLGHVCPLKCGEDCAPCNVLVMKTLPCGHAIKEYCQRESDDPETKCLTIMDVTLPSCEHKVQKHCYQDINKLECLEPCMYRLEGCGHVCSRKCHVADDPNHENYTCTKPCARAKAGCTADLIGDRGDHQCRKKCNEECDDCLVEVNKVILECLHTIKVQCKQSVSRELCNEKCKRLLVCGHRCMDRCGAVCDRTKCTKPSFGEVMSPCGHKLKLPCNVSDLFARGLVTPEQLLQHCASACTETLACGHVCGGTCARCVQGRVHQPCTQTCNQDNICGHQCQEPCSQICPPCEMFCEVKCPHSHCKKLCGQPCTPCQEKCNRRCVHGACTRRCGETCDRPPCDERCPRRLACGHMCRGLCGEPCPDICQICRPDEFPVDFFGDQYEEHDKFILLQDCGHILEVQNMDAWMLGDQENIKMRTCPFCRKAIINTNRYKDTLNSMFKNEINPIKVRFYGTDAQILSKLTELRRKMDQFTEKYEINMEDYMKVMFSSFANLIGTQRKVSLLQVEMECIYLNIFEMIVECWQKYQTQKPPVTTLRDELQKHIKTLLVVLKINPESKMPIKISEQQQKDVGNEIKRLNVMVQLSKLLHIAIKIEGEPRVTQQVEATKAVVFSLSVFNEDRAIESLKQLQETINTSGVVTKYERAVVFKAMGLKAGHWYKCPNGHIYCIGESGLAHHVSKCPECGASIGGTHKKLIPGNTRAPEMFESNYAACSSFNFNGIL